MKRAIRFFLLKVLPPILVFVIVAGAMQIYVVKARVPKYKMAPPGAVFHRMITDWEPLATALWTTAKASLIGFSAAAVFGIVIAVILASSTILRRAFYPYTVFFQTVPIVAIAPLLVIWFDAGLTSVSISAFIVSVFPVIANTLAGLLSTDPALVDLFELYQANPFQRLWKLRLPAALPNIMTGLRVAAGLAVIGSVVGEFLVGELGDEEGLGVKIVAATKNGWMDQVFAEVLIASFLGLAMFAAVNVMSHLLLRRWHSSEQNTLD
jgi:NitT/TauT family transport system permease protein